jgi:hypothetical protein
VVVRETGPKDLFAVGRRAPPEGVLEPPRKADVDVLLIDDQAIELDQRHVGGHRVEAVADERVLEELDQERFVLRSQRCHGRVVGEPGLGRRQLAHHIARRVP